jgi:transposase
MTSTEAPANSPMIPTKTVALPEDLCGCHALIQQLLEVQGEKDRTIEHLKHRLALALRRMYGPRAEHFDVAQLLLFAKLIEQMPIDPQEAPPAAAPEKTITVTRRIGHGRKPLPAHLPRHRIEYPIDPKDLPCPCCGQERTRIGQEISEQLEHFPASFMVLEHVRPKLACKHCEQQGQNPQIIIADKPAQPIDKGLPGPGLLAHVITC